MAVANPTGMRFRTLLSGLGLALLLPCLLAVSIVLASPAAASAGAASGGSAAGGADLGALLPLLLLITAAVARRALAATPISRAARRTPLDPRR